MCAKPARHSRPWPADVIETKFKNHAPECPKGSALKPWPTRLFVNLFTCRYLLVCKYQKKKKGKKSPRWSTARELEVPWRAGKIHSIISQKLMENRSKPSIERMVLWRLPNIQGRRTQVVFRTRTGMYWDVDGSGPFPSFTLSLP